MAPRLLRHPPNSRCRPETEQAVVDPPPAAVQVHLFWQTPLSSIAIHCYRQHPLVLFQLMLLLVAHLPNVCHGGHAHHQPEASGSGYPPESPYHGAPGSGEQRASLVAAGSIFDSLLGTSSSNGNSAAHQLQLQQQQTAAADLHHQNYKIGQTSDKVTLPGDILLGGLFPIHMKGTKVECGEINRDRGIQRLEAMLYALDRINEDSELLPEIKLGAILLDSCSSSTYALNQSLEFIRASINTVESSAFECKDKSTPRPKYGSKMIAGVIGGSYSEVSLQVANLLRLFRIPQVSYASTGTALSDKTLYDLFARTVPSDMFQARAIADIVLKLNWSYVSLVSSEGLYGDSGSKEFMKQASVRRICIATHEKVSPTTDGGAYDIIVANLLKRNATGVVLFTRAEDTKELLKAVKRAGLFNNFAWVAADGWGTHQKLVEGVEEVAWGAITVELQAKAIPGFDQYMKALTPWGNLRNPWFSEYWQEWFDCQLQANLIQQQQVASGVYSSRRDVNTGLDYGPPSSGGGGDSQDSDYAESQMRRRSLPDEKCTHTCGTNVTGSGSCIARANVSSSSSTATTSTTSSTTTTTTTEAPSSQKTLVSRSKRSPDHSALLAGVGDETVKPKQFCSPNLRISESNSYRQEQKVQFVVDAVYAMAHALHKAWHQLCDARPGVVCEALKELNGGEFYAKYLLNVSFKDLAGSEVKFDEHGDGLGRYNIYNYRQVKPQISSPNLMGLIRSSNGGGYNSSGGDANGNMDELEESDSLAGKQSEPLEGESNSGADNNVRQLLAATNEAAQLATAPDSSAGLADRFFAGKDARTFEYSAIGRWDENEYYLHLEDIEFIQGDRLIPESYCSRPCELGQAKIMRAGDHCCWICKTCAPYEYLPDEFNCRDCGIGRWPELNKTSCFDLPQKYLRWDSVYSLMSLTIACLGIALTIFVSVIFIKYLDTPVVKASGRELSFILLAGIGFCHLSTFVLLSKPTPFICGSQRFLVNFGFALMYASLLVKTNRISRIFNCARKSAKRPSFISPKSQMLITGILVAIQIFLTIVWFVFEPPGIRADSPEGKRDEVILKCRAKGKSFIISLVYNMILITTCTIYAVKTRKIPENFNESKFIGFTMYTTIVIWLAFVTMFFGTNNSYEIQINTMCVCISLSAYVTLFCLFSPKLSIILLHPDKNVRKLTMNSATYKRSFKPVSSFASVDGRNNTTGTAYQWAQTDGGSGPMSTTSNVLNLGKIAQITSLFLAAESQAARQQESSTVSNVVNSNSAGSNCSNSQKTPTTLSQQLTLVGACANCGSHQLTQLPAGSSGTQTANEMPGPAPRGAGNQQDQAAGPRVSSSQQLRSGFGPGDRPLVSTSRSAILVSSTPADNKQGGGTKAKVLHSKILAQQQQQQQEGSTGSAIPKRISSDDHLLIGHSGSHNCGSVTTPCGSNQQQAFGSASTCKRAAGADLSKNGRHLASLSRLNELTSTTSSDRHFGIDESISSLANDSLVNTSQENTPCNVAGLTRGHLHGPASAARGEYATPGKLGSDSMLWNQSVYSIDYCSDCCPSYCHCSCAACSLSNGAEEAGQVQTEGGGGHSICAQTTSSRHDTEAEDYDAMLDCSLMVQGDECGQHHHHHQEQQGSGFLIRRRKSEEPGRGSGCYYFGGQANARMHQLQQQQQQKKQAATAEQEIRVKHGTFMTRPVVAADPENFSDTISRARRSQTMEMRTIATGVEQAAPGTGVQLGGQGSSKLVSKSQPTSTSIDETAEQQVRKSANSKLPAGHRRNPVGSSQPVVYALQAAATSALGGCTGSQVVSSLESGPTNGSQQQQHQQQHYIQFTSTKDKNSERRQHTSWRSDGSGADGHAVHHPSQSSRYQQPTAGGGPHEQQLVVKPLPKGAIETSIELVKSTSRRRSADARRQNRENSCFNYHDDYEYNYGLVQSNSDSENYCCEEDSGDGDADTRASSIPRDESDAGRMHPSGTRQAYDRNYRFRPEDDDAFRDADGDGEEEDEEDDGDDNYDDDGDDDDDFEHDGRVTLNRQRANSSTSRQQDRYRKRTRRSSVKNRGTRSGSGSCSRRSQSSAGKDQFQMEDHRINSVALIAATLSAGGAIVESGASSQRQVSSGAQELAQADNRTSASDTVGLNPRADQDYQESGNKPSNTTLPSNPNVKPIDGTTKGEGNVSCLTTL